jgi:hypothetical protein
MNGLLMKFTSDDRTMLHFKSEPYLNLRLRIIHNWWLANSNCVYLPVWKMIEIQSPSSKDRSKEQEALGFNFFRR